MERFLDSTLQKEGATQAISPAFPCFYETFFFFEQQEISPLNAVFFFLDIRTRVDWTGAGPPQGWRPTISA